MFLVEYQFSDSYEKNVRWSTDDMSCIQSCANTLIEKQKKRMKKGNVRCEWLSRYLAPRGHGERHPTEPNPVAQWCVTRENQLHNPSTATMVHPPFRGQSPAFFPHFERAWGPRVGPRLRKERGNNLESEAKKGGRKKANKQEQGEKGGRRDGRVGIAGC